MAQLLNTATTGGVYDSVPVDATTELTVELSALSITKSADKSVWVGGELTYTIVVTNIDNGTPGLDVTAVTLTDTIDSDVATLVAGSVTINGTLAEEGTDYTFVDGVLSFLTLADLAPGETHTIIFQVEMV